MRKRRLIGCLLVVMVLLSGLFADSNVSAKMVLPEAAGKNTEENEQMIIDYSNISKGYVMVKYKESTKVRVKAQMACPTNNKYTFDLTVGKWATFPLTEGDGSYTVTVYKNVSTTGNQYLPVGSVTFTAKLSSELAPFETANQYVNYAANTKCVTKAKSLCKGKKKEMDKVKAVYNWTIGYFSYDKKKAQTVQSGYLPDLNKVYNAKKGICFDYASTMTAMLRSQGVPTKLVIGYAGSAYHAWISVYTKEKGWVNDVIKFDGKKWNRMDPTFASTSKQSKSVMEYIGDGKNYKEVYAY